MITTPTPWEKAKKTLSALVALVIGVGVPLWLLGSGLVKLWGAPWRLVHYSLLPMLAGVICEFRLLSKSWKTVLITSLVALLLSALVCGAMLSDDASGDAIRIWPFVFMIFLVMGATLVLFNTLVQPLNEGITMLQSLGVLYLVVEHRLWATGLPGKIATAVVLLLLLFSAALAVFNIALTGALRLFMSTWSSVSVIALTVYNGLAAYQLSPAQRSFAPWLVYLQFFLLGSSAIYLANNLGLLLGLIPGKGNDVRGMIAVHQDRFSDEQITTGSALLVLVAASVIFSLNYAWHFLLPGMAVWSVFVLFPPALKLLSRRRR